MTTMQSIRRALRDHRRFRVLAAAGVLLPFMHGAAFADDAKDEELEEVVVKGDRLRVMQTDPVDSVLGFGKRVDETPRAVTTISNELLEKTIITEIDDLVAMVPGSYTQSFFGVAGSLDLRGNPGENYFRGVKRIDNPGNYPTAIGASDRIDIVRGPASPIYGPSKIGGYMNFVPKSSRAENGKYLSDTTGEIGVTTGSWGKKVLDAEVGGPLSLAGKDGGYYLYGESENSGSYYENTGTEQTILQASVDFNLSDTWRTEFGGMYQYFKGNQVAGWNRLTQDLIDHGTYITGSPTNLDDPTANDPNNAVLANKRYVGYLDPTEANAANGGAGLFSYNFGTGWTPSGTDLGLTSSGTTHLKGSQVLVQDDDNLSDNVTDLYFDLIGDLGNGWNTRNKLFFENLDNNNENAYGFSQYAQTYVVEDQFNTTFSRDFDTVKTSFQFGPSIRYQNFEHGDNFGYEYFDRRDLSLGPDAGSPIDRRTMATRGQELYSTHTKGHFTDYGLAFMADLTFSDLVDLTGGARYDYLDMSSTALADSTDYSDVGPDHVDLAGQTVTGNDHAFSWSGSLTFNVPGGLHPYFSIAKQSTLILGQGGQIPTDYLYLGNAVGGSKLKEGGVKGTFLDNKLYAAVDYFNQQRVDYNAQDTVTNNSTRSKGWEAELRWVATDLLTMTGAYSNLKVINLGPSADSQFSFMGGQDLINLGFDPSAVYGGVAGWNIATPDHRKAGIPENIYSLNLLFGFDPWIQGLSGTLSGTHVDSVYSGYSKSVKLPSYTLLNAGLRYEYGKWAFGVESKNLTNEHYFRSNFPDLFGSSVVLPELPRSFLVTANYKF